ncbi:DNA alkylation repair protein [Pseudochryseolinea flava]|uniref:DNA alkylation repair protein n=1 Tax=Pseudochryseolinea flava TaxID=2059302 RepID=A0A364Y1W2_9BACT|nr:DNA alkylation repair protein [Pseudochryseolinea flava]RAW00855.1 DNA alkylation repair protein [Pseudochryseolinea flava]
MAKKQVLKSPVKTKASQATRKSITKNAPTAKHFIALMKTHQSDEELIKIQRYFKSGEGEYGAGDKFMGIRMGTLFKLAKDSIEMSPTEISKLLDHSVHEVRAGALSIMNYQARAKKTDEVHRKVLFDLYLKKHNRINNWDLVDLAAQFVVGGYLFIANKSRDVLYKLATSKNMWERRTSMVSTAYFIRQGELDDTFQIAALLLNDKQDLIHKAAGGWIREAGKQDQKKLVAFLDKHAATMPRTMLRYAIEKLNEKQKDYYMGLKAAS